MRGDVEVDLALGGDVDVAVVHPSLLCSTYARCLICESESKSGS